MDRKEYERIIECILFAAGEPIAADKLCVVLGVDRMELDEICKGMADELDYNRRGIRLLRLGDTYQFATRTEYAHYIRRAMEVRRPSQLSQAALEVLAIAAYRQPVTRAYIEQVRGVDSSNTVSTLIERGLLEECGRLDVPGRPHLFCTTPIFLRTFGLSSIEDLPPLPEEGDGEQISLLQTDYDSGAVEEESAYSLEDIVQNEDEVAVL